MSEENALLSFQLHDASGAVLSPGVSYLYGGRGGSVTTARDARACVRVCAGRIVRYRSTVSGTGFTRVEGCCFSPLALDWEDRACTIFTLG